MQHLEKAIWWAGGVNKLGRLLGINHSNICHWKRKKEVPAKHAVKIEQLTNGQIRAVDMLSDCQQAATE